MEDLREEPELEECEEEEEEEENIHESNGAEYMDQQSEDDQQEEKDESNNEDGELLVRPVRNAIRRVSLDDESTATETQALLETNFSVTGINEIKTERIRPNNRIKDTPKRPISLDLNAPIVFRKSRGGVRFEKVTARLIEQPKIKRNL